jgi:transcriptional regulator with XRE-family HTH domain
MTITRKSVQVESARRMRHPDHQLGEEIHRLRLDAGVAVVELASIVGVHRSYVARIEAGVARPSLPILTAIGVALGADLSLRYFAGSGPRLHDRFQAPILESILHRLGARWRPQVEVPVNNPSRGVIDLVLTDRASPTVVAGEVQSELRRLEQQIRWSTEKADGLARKLAEASPTGASIAVSRLLILRSTVTTRELARTFEATLATAYPARAEDVVSALTTSRVPWPGPGIIWVRLEGGRATILDHPPRGVRLGR